ncbi:MAG: tetratricopeptide repeat protein, partial [Sphingobium sp.]
TVLAVASSAGSSQQPAAPHRLSALSIEWQGKGDLARKSGKLDDANNAYESALAADPQNRGAYMALAEIARGQGLQGKAIRFYGEALALNPTDVNALSGQGQALAEKGAIAQAQNILARIKPLCKSACLAANQLAASIKTQSSARAAALLAAKDTEPTPGGNNAPSVTQKP